MTGRQITGVHRVEQDIDQVLLDEPDLFADSAPGWELLDRFLAADAAWQEAHADKP